MTVFSKALGSLRRALSFLASFLGPVVDAVQGELSKEERARVLVTAIVLWVTTGVPVWSASNGDLMSNLVLPTGIAVVTGIMESVRRLRHGDPKPPEVPVTEVPPPPPPEVSP